MMRSLNRLLLYRSSSKLLSERSRVGAIHFGNEISGTVHRAVRKLKPFPWNCLIDVTKSVQSVLCKAICDQSIADAVRFFLVGNRFILTDNLTSRPLF